MLNFCKIKKINKGKENSINNNLFLHKKFQYWEFNIINSNIFQKLDNILNIEESNLYIYGNNGTGKTTLARYYIYKYNNDVYKNDLLTKKTMIFNKKELIYFKGKYHTEIYINLYNFIKWDIIYHFLKLVLVNQEESLSGKKNIILIKNVELLNNNFIKNFKNIFEKFYNSNIFIFISNKFNKKLVNFFIPIRIPQSLPSEQKLLCREILKYCNISLSKENIIDKIIKFSNGDINNIIILLEFHCLYGEKGKMIDEDLQLLKILFKCIIDKKFKNLVFIRNTITQLLIKNTKYNKILHYLIKEFTNLYKKNNLDLNKLQNIIKIVADIDQKLILGLRKDIHIEYLCIKIMNIL